MANEQVIKLISLIGSIVLGIGIILLVILLPLSFSYLDFYEVFLIQISNVFIFFKLFF